MKKVMCYFGLFLLLPLSSLSCQSSEENTVVTLPQKPLVVLKPYARINFEPIRESSGLVKSRHNPNVLWTLNDSGDKARIFAIDLQGNVIKPATSNAYEGIFITDAQNKDWEDIATDDQGNLIIGDCGNNDNSRGDLSFILIKEPSPTTDETAPVSLQVPFHYPDQDSFPPKIKNFDAEAIFWLNGKIYLLTKHRSDPFTKLYRLDSMNPYPSNALTWLGQFDVKGMVTAADVTPDGKKLAVLTYNAIWLFEAPEDSDHYFQGKISWLPIFAKQCESICFHNNALIIGNEQRELFEVALDSLIVVGE